MERQVSAARAERLLEEAHSLPQLWPEPEQLMDAEKIGTGAYSPLTGFMDASTVESVLDSSRLPSTIPWTIPILLTPPGPRNARTLRALRSGDDVALLDDQDRFVAVLHLEEKFSVDRSRLAQQTYRTRDPAHPNVADLIATGDTALAGTIDLVTQYRRGVFERELTPAETRRAFQKRHWSSVAAYQTRNVPHMAHERLHRLALEREDVDALFIHPVLGRLKPGDYRPDVVMRAYDLLVQGYLPTSRVMVAPLRISMRYAGPRAALFLAIVRKNFGCSHYIVGRDQAGVGQYYDPYDSQRIFDEFPVGVVPLRFAESWYCHRCGEVASGRTCEHSPKLRESISQTSIRRAIARGTPLPPHLLRPEVLRLLSQGPQVLNSFGPGTGRERPPPSQGEPIETMLRGTPAGPPNDSSPRPPSLNSV